MTLLLDTWVPSAQQNVLRKSFLASKALGVGDVEYTDHVAKLDSRSLRHTSGFAGCHEDLMASHVVYQFHRMSSADGAEMENVFSDDGKLLTSLLKYIVIAADHERQRACRCA